MLTIVAFVLTEEAGASAKTLEENRACEKAAAAESVEQVSVVAFLTNRGLKSESATDVAAYLEDKFDIKFFENLSQLDDDDIDIIITANKLKKLQGLKFKDACQEAKSLRSLKKSSDMMHDSMHRGSVKDDPSHSVITYKNEELRHIGWLGEFEGRIALVENRSDTTIVLKIGQDLGHWKREQNILLHLTKSSVAQHVVELMNAFDGSLHTLADGAEPPYYLELEWLGDSLADWFKVATPSADEVQVVAREVCSILAALHSVGVWHMDFKPSKLCFVHNQSRLHLKLVGFDSARTKDENPFAPIESFTQNFTAPEVVIHHKAGSLASLAPHRSVDLWCAGLILGQLFHPMLEPVYPSGEIAIQHLSGQITPIIPEKAISAIKRQGHRQLVGQLLSVNPEERPEMTYVLDEPVFALGTRSMFPSQQKLG